MVEHMDPGLLAFLREPASYPHGPREVRELRTHASLVFIVPPLVYKIKRPVDFGFLNYSTLERRLHFCRREVELNSRLAPGVYLGVEAITREDGGFAFGGGGPVVEYAVKMALLEPGGFLDARLEAGTAGVAELERVASALADFYQTQVGDPGIAEWGSIGKLRISTDENFAQTEAFVGRTLSRAAFEAIRGFTEACYERRRALFEERVAGGWIRDCHGDLHLDHVHVTDEALRIYDCIEFNDRLRHVDVASDVAFLAMDLDFHGRPDLGRFLVRRIGVLLGDPSMERLMDFHKCYRAYVRGKVESLHSVAKMAGACERAEAAEQARRYFQLALRYAVCGPDPRVLVFMGRVASGKSTLAAAVAGELGWPLLSSDVLRKTLSGVPMHVRGTLAERQRLYTPAKTERTYRHMIRQAREILAGGHGVILDATFARQAHRDRLRERLGDGSLQWIVVQADEATARERLRQRAGRKGVVSDARMEDMEMLNAAFEPPDELDRNGKRIICTDDGEEKVTGRLLLAMARDAGAGRGASRRQSRSGSPGSALGMENRVPLTREPEASP
jgi:hypothetical protein